MRLCMCCSAQLISLVLLVPGTRFCTLSSNTPKKLINEISGSSNPEGTGDEVFLPSHEDTGMMFTVATFIFFFNGSFVAGCWMGRNE